MFYNTQMHAHTHTEVLFSYAVASLVQRQESLAKTADGKAMMPSV